eukprot:scaffold81193_cov68-Attheya_sp.AAC.2
MLLKSATQDQSSVLASYSIEWLINLSKGSSNLSVIKEVNEQILLSKNKEQRCSSLLHGASQVS